MQMCNSERSDKMFYAVYKECQTRIPSYAHRILADWDEAQDISTDSFIKLWLQRESFHSTDKMKAFLKVCTTNTCLNRLKSLERRGRRVYEIQQFYYGTGITEVLEKVAESREAALTRVIQSLDRKYQDCICFFYFEKMPISKIASRLNISERNARFFLTEGRKRIKSALGAN